MQGALDRRPSERVPCFPFGPEFGRLETPLPPKAECSQQRPRSDHAATTPRLKIGPLKLETTGVTSQQTQREFWRSQTAHKNAVAAKLRSIGLDDLAAELEDCHSRYVYAECTNCHHTTPFANHCDRFYCPECQPQLAKGRARAVEWWARRIEQPKHMVLTVRNIADMTKAHVQQFKRWFARLRRRKFARKWRGGFYSIEVTNEGNGWHLHLHALVDARYIDQFQLSREWSDVTNGLGRIVKVQDARRHDYLREVTKYAVKGNQLAAWTPQQISDFIRAFTGVRTFGVFGSLYGKRTEWKDWVKFLSEHARTCTCGCSNFRYLSELQMIERDLVPVANLATRPPPVPQIEFHLR